MGTGTEVTGTAVTGTEGTGIEGTGTEGTGVTEGWWLWGSGRGASPEALLLLQPLPLPRHLCPQRPVLLCGGDRDRVGQGTGWPGGQGIGMTQRTQIKMFQGMGIRVTQWKG